MTREDKLRMLLHPDQYTEEQLDQMLQKTDSPVPVAFYKVILDMTPPMKMIGFVIPNQPTKRRLQSFVVSVDDVEALTGCDFFSGLDDETEERLEKEADLSAWK